MATPSVEDKIITALEIIGRPARVTEITDTIDAHIRATIGKTCLNMSNKKKLRRWPGSRNLVTLYGLRHHEYPNELDRTKRKPRTRWI